jgi:maltose phosphorylase
MASLDLNTCTAVKTFVAIEYEGRLVQSFLWSNASKRYQIVNIRRFLSIVLDEVGIINYELLL